MRLVSSFVFSIAFLGVARADDAADLKAMVGKWKIEKAELAGKNSLALFKNLKFEIMDGGKYAIDILGQKDTGMCTVDSSKTPKEMDIKSMDGANKGKTIKTIYKIEGDTLTVAYDFGDKRPEKFESKPDSMQFYAVYKRMK